MSKRRKKKGKKNGTVKIIILAVILLLACFILGKMYLGSGAGPFDAASENYVSITVPAGTGTGAIGTMLEENGIIKSASKFKLIAKTSGCDGKFKAGDYSLSPSMSTDEIMEILIVGKVNVIRFTVPEGLTVEQTAERLAGKDMINKEAFLDEVKNGDFDQNFVKDLPDGENRLEGFLFPETYDVYASADEHAIIDKMLSQFDKIYGDDYYAKASELGVDINQVITIASLIERESQVAEERPLVASVIYNRLDVGMPLQIDATVQYALGEHKDRLSTKDTEIESPYNTYQNKGLPPGPICSPGAESIKAALYPADTDYFYYVLKSKGSGTHNFTNTYEEFLKYKKEYINSL